jgi:hypothetical protein
MLTRVQFFAWGRVPGKSEGIQWQSFNKLDSVGRNIKVVGVA